MSELMPGVVLTDEQYLQLTQSLRHDMINNLITDDNGQRRLPSDPESVNAIKGLMKDMDANVFTKKRLTVEETAVENDKKAAELLAQVARQVGGPRRFDDPIEGEATEVHAGPDLSNVNLPEFDIPDTALEIAGAEIDVETIIQEERRKRKGEED